MAPTQVSSCDYGEIFLKNFFYVAPAMAVFMSIQKGRRGKFSNERR